MPPGRGIHPIKNPPLRNYLRCPMDADGGHVRSAAKLVPGLRSLAGGAAVSISAGVFIYAVGQVFIEHFESGGTLLSFNARQKVARVRDFIRKHGQSSHQPRKGRSAAASRANRAGAAPRAKMS